MSNKERTKIRRNNYRAWKQSQKQKQQLGVARSSGSFHRTSRIGRRAAGGRTQSQPRPSNNRTAPDSPRPGASIPFNPSAPADLTSLYERLRYGGPDVTDEERIAIAHRMEQPRCQLRSAA